MKKIDEVRNRVNGYFDIIGSPDTPLSAKILLVAAIVYFLSPIDLIPDFIPVIGYVDDLIIVPTLIWLAFRQIEAARRAAENREVFSSNLSSGKEPETIEPGR